MGVGVGAAVADHQSVAGTLSIEPTGEHHEREDEENSSPDGGLS